jgi:hypothetical protein
MDNDHVAVSPSPDEENDSPNAAAESSRPVVVTVIAAR